MRGETLPRVLLLLLVLLVGCERPAPSKPPPPLPPADLPGMFGDAARAEAKDAMAAEPYLRAIERAVGQRDDPWALPTTLAALDALVWRRVEGAPAPSSHAVAYRSRPRLIGVTARLRKIWEGAEKAPLLRGLLAHALHELAAKVGAEPEAASWRRLAGCLPMATVAGPHAWPPLAALERASPIPPFGKYPAELRGVPPFATTFVPERVHADGCMFPLDATGPLGGLRTVTVDLDNPRRQWIYVGLLSNGAARVSLGGAPLVHRRLDEGSEATLHFAVAEADAGRVRLIARVAGGAEASVGLFALAQDGAPLASLAPVAGDEAPAKVHGGYGVRLVPEGERTAGQVVTGVAALLAAGRGRRASELIEATTNADAKPEAMVELARLRALEAARAMPRTRLQVRAEAIAKRIAELCPDCWEGRLAVARAAAQRKGSASGALSALESLGVRPGDEAWTGRLGPLELAYVAVQAEGADLHDIARRGYDALAKVSAGSFLLADIDWQLHRRAGRELWQAACSGGLDRRGTRCLTTHIQRSDLRATLAEMARLRRLRGTPAALRQLELSELLKHGEMDAALRLYQALPLAERPLALLGAWFGESRQAEAKKLFAADMIAAPGAPYAYQPLARLFGVVPDRAFDFEKQGAALVARDRHSQYLPGAATAVLSRIEHYQLRRDGLLHFWSYDLRRVSGTADVAGSAEGTVARVRGRTNTRLLRRRIYKQDGRVLDPDPRSRGSQGHTDLSQLQQGDYVESVTEGWALPEDHGQLVVDTPDVLPRRTSVREAEIRLTRPVGVPLKVWSHVMLGQGEEQQRAGDIVTTWRLRDQPPRRMQSGVPPLEARVAISFGTDSYARIARAVGEHLRRLDDHDPFMARWVQKALGEGELTPEQKVARLVAAVGKAVRRGDAYALSDSIAAYSSGAQYETARRILERGTGSRSWVVHRALREVGLSSSIAISETYPFSAAPSFPPRTGRFSHPLVRVEIDGKTHLWIDADVDGPPLPPGRVSPELRGRQALLPSGGLVAVEGAIGAEPDVIEVALELAKSGDATGTFKARLHGRPAQHLTEAFETEVGEQREARLRAVVLQWLPWADVTDVKLSSEPGSWEVVIEASVSIVGFAQPEDKKRKAWSIPGMQPLEGSGTLASRYTAQAKRTSALAIGSPLLYRVSRSVTLPAGAKVVRLARGLGVKGQQVTANRTVAHEGQVLEDTFELNLPVGTVELDDFEHFAADVRQIDDGFAFGTRVQLEP